MTRAQYWFSNYNSYGDPTSSYGNYDSDHYKKERAKVVKFELRDKNLEGELIIKDFPNLQEIDLSSNMITKLVIKGCPSLIKLDIENNDFSETDLSFLSSLISLKTLYVGNCNLERIRKNVYNRFNGSLETLRNLTKLETLIIRNTDIDSGVEHLPSSLNFIYCDNNVKSII